MNKKYSLKRSHKCDTANSEENLIAIKTIATVIMLTFLIITYPGCSGGGSGSNSGNAMDQTPGNLVHGVFIDSPVEGLYYQTATHMGITDAQGRFQCIEGEMITFMLGDIMLGQTMADEIITPMDFLDESAVPYDVTNPMITNMGRFLQSLDADGDPENGITITDRVIQEISGRMIDFHQGIEDFENDPDVIACFEVLNALNMPHYGLTWELCPVEDARQHMNTHMSEFMNDHMEPGSSVDTGGNTDDPMMEVNSGSGSKPANLVQGAFIDSPVEGLYYQTATHMGITDAQGRFQCIEGEMITFMLGDIMLGQTMADEIITPMDFLDESAVPYDVTNPMITNMGRFLQSLDADGDPENGITITDRVIQEISGRMIDFHQGIEDFENDPDVIACFEVLNALNMPHYGLTWELCPVEDARQHMNTHMSEFMNAHMWLNPSF